MAMDTIDPEDAADRLTVAENALVAFAQGDRASRTDTEADNEAAELLRVFAAAAEALTAALAPHRVDAGQAAWLVGKQAAFAHGWEARFDSRAGSDGCRLVRAHREVLDGLRRCTDPEQEEELRGLLRELEHELAGFAAAGALAAGDHAELAAWLSRRAQGAMH